MDFKLNSEALIFLMDDKVPLNFLKREMFTHHKQRHQGDNRHSFHYLQDPLYFVLTMFCKAFHLNMKRDAF